MVLNRALMGVLRGRGTCQRPDLKLQTLKASCDVAHAITHMPCILITTQMETYEHCTSTVLATHRFHMWRQNHPAP